jgi:hypothetical protein
MVARNAEDSCAELQQAIVGLNIIGKLYWMASRRLGYTALA